MTLLTHAAPINSVKNKEMATHSLQISLQLGLPLGNRFSELDLRL